MNQTYLTTQELAGRIKYDERYIRECLKDSVLLEGIHYLRPFGGRKILYVWERIEQDMTLRSQNDELSIPMANGGGLPWVIAATIQPRRASGLPSINPCAGALSKSTKRGKLHSLKRASPAATRTLPRK